MRGCSNPTCDGSDVAGSPKTITVNYTVTPAPALTATPASLAFETTTGNNPPPQDITLQLSNASVHLDGRVAAIPASARVG